MNKFWKWLLIVLGILVVLGVIAVAIIGFTHGSVEWDLMAAVSADLMDSATDLAVLLCWQTGRF